MPGLVNPKSKGLKVGTVSSIGGLAGITEKPQIEEQTPPQRTNMVSTPINKMSSMNINMPDESITTELDRKSKDLDNQLNIQRGLPKTMIGFNQELKTPTQGMSIVPQSEMNKPVEPIQPQQNMGTTFKNITMEQENQLKTRLKTDYPDLTPEKRLEKAQSIVKMRESTGKVKPIEPTQPQEQGLFSEIGSKLKTRIGETQERLKQHGEEQKYREKMGVSGATTEGTIRKGLDVLFGVAGGVQDIVGSVVGKGLEKAMDVSDYAKKEFDKLGPVGKTLTAPRLGVAGLPSAMKDNVVQLAKTELGQQALKKIGEGQESYNKRASENPETSKDIEGILNVGMTIGDVVGAGELVKGGKQLIQKGIKKAPGMIKGIVKEAPKSAYEIKEGLKEGVKTVKGLIPKSTVKGATMEETMKALAKTPISKTSTEAKQIVGKIIQGETKDIAPALRTFSNIDTKGIKSYKDLGLKLSDKGDELMKGVDTIMDADKNIYKASDFDIITKVGNTEVKQNYVKKGLDQLEELYTKIDDPIKQAKITELKNKFNTEGLSLKESNNLARQYNSEFGKKAFGKTGEPLTSVNAQSYENIRKGIKESVRNKLPNEGAKLLDKQYSDLIQTKELVNKMEESVNKLTQKIKERGLVEKLARGVGKILDTATMGGARGFLTSFLPSNVGNKVMNAIDIESVLKNNLKNLNKLISKIDDGTLTKLDIDNLIPKQIKNVDNLNNRGLVTNIQQSKQIAEGLKAPQPYSLQGEATYKPNFKMVEKPKALPQPGGLVENPIQKAIKEGAKKVNVYQMGGLTKGTITDLGKVQEMRMNGKIKEYLINNKWIPEGKINEAYEIPKQGLKTVSSFADEMSATTKINEGKPKLENFGQIRKTNLNDALDLAGVKNLEELPKNLQDEAIRLSRKSAMGDIEKSGREVEKRLNDVDNWKKITPIYEKATLVDDLVNTIKQEGGITFNTKKLQSIASKPYVAVSPYPNRGQIIKIDDFNNRSLIDFLKKNQDLVIKEGHNLGGRIDDGKVYLDISINIPKKNLDIAKKLGKKYNQKAIFDLENFKEIETFGDGSPIKVNENEIRNDIKDYLD